MGGGTRTHRVGLPFGFATTTKPSEPFLQHPKLSPPGGSRTHKAFRRQIKSLVQHQFCVWWKHIISSPPGGSRTHTPRNGGLIKSQVQRQFCVERSSTPANYREKSSSVRHRSGLTRGQPLLMQGNKQSRRESNTAPAGWNVVPFPCSRRTKNGETRCLLLYR